MTLSHKRDGMPLLLLLLFPLAEIATFIVVGGAIGVVRTLALVVVSAVIGIIVLRDAGAMTALKLQRQRGNPVTILAEGGSRMLAGVLLLIPGFLTDIAAVLILIPALRRLLFAKLASAGTAPVRGETEQPSKIIDGDFRRLDTEK
ncbi:MAG: FxsA cytoplasmic rane protein [Rhodospirillales bacterium]|nr:FxsA cytoplasmic rane protein [Rhodospirillales bacterium]